MMAERPGPLAHQSTSLVDILDRVLDKGLVVAGDIKISLANVELLTIQIRLLVCSIDKAEQIGLNWWRYDRNLVYEPPEQSMIAELRQRIAQLETELALHRAETPAGDERATTDDRRPTTDEQPTADDQG